MKKILLVKTSSLGDVVHNLPVVSDIRHRYADACIDWAVEEAYAPLVELNRELRRALPVAVRRWRSRLLAPATWREIAAFRRVLKGEEYDEVIDTQGLLKSALIAATARGERHGFDRTTAREPLAARFYNSVHHVPRDRHAVERNRLLVAAALGYELDRPPDFGLSVARGKEGDPYVVFLHGTSRRDKEWPEASWVALGKSLGQAGLRIVLPWGGDAERNRAGRIAASLSRAEVPRTMSLTDMARLLGNSAAVVGVDTGLAHLAAALGVPVVALYCATDPALTGIYRGERCVNLGGIGSNPSPGDALQALESRGVL